jgi:cytochrome c553
VQLVNVQDPKQPSAHHTGRRYAIGRLTQDEVTSVTRKMMSAKVLVLAALCTLAVPAWAESVAEQQLAAALSAKPDVQRGASLFKACVRCHNSDGSGELDGDVPAIAGQYQGVLLRQLVDFHYGKRWDVRMEAIANSHDLSRAQDLADVAAYVSALPRFTAPGRGDGQQLAHGMQVYQSECASCHGPSGRGDARKAVPWLAGQHYKYLLREMYYTTDNRRPNLSNHRVFLDRFTRPDYEGVADYLSGLISPPGGP